MENPARKTENLKKLVFKLYGEHKLKDLDFFKYLVWSGQGDLCKLIGYGDKQIEKFEKDKPIQDVNQRPRLNIPDGNAVNQRPRLNLPDGNAAMDSVTDAGN